MARRIVAFDVIGTLFDFEGIAPRLVEAFGCDHIIAKLIAMQWYYAAQRDFTYIDISDGYTAIAQVFKATLPRAVRMSLPQDRAISQAQIQHVCSDLPKLPPRPTLDACFTKLREAGFEIWLVTNGGEASTRGLFEHARGSMPSLHPSFTDNIVSCDVLRAAKPSPRVYSHLIERASVDAGNSFFVAAHAWDLYAAKRVGMQTVYLTSEEHDATEDIFGKPDLQGDSLAELADLIIAST